MSYCALLTRQEHRVIVLCPHAMNGFFGMPNSKLSAAKCWRYLTRLSRCLLIDDLAPPALH